MERRPVSPMLLLALGLALFGFGAWSAMHVIRLRLDGTATNAVVLRVEHRTSGIGRHRRSETFTVLRVHEHECTLSGDLGHPGQMVPVHYANGRPSDCAIDGGAALRMSVMTGVPGLLILVAAYFGFRRASASGPGRGSER